jgi:type IV pilus assembly protein PilV
MKELILPMRRKGINNTGFTLIEVLIGIVILAIGLLGIAGLQVSATRGNFFSNYITQATYSAQAGLEFLENMGLSSPQLQPGNHNDTPLKINDMTFNRSYAIAINGSGRTITYTVTWNDGRDRTVSFSTLRFQ